MSPSADRVVRYVLLGDGESPHLLKWARALARARLPDGRPLALYAASTRGFTAAWADWVPPERRLVLGAHLQAGGGNVGILSRLPRLVHWLRQVDADWIHAHYLTSSGTLAWLSRLGGQLRGRLIASAWGSDVLVTPDRSRVLRALTQRVLRAAVLCTSDSQVMTARMRELGAREVMTFPFGLEALPPEPGAPKLPWRVFANRALEPIYRPQAVLALFAQLYAWQPEARLVVANDGSLRASLQHWVVAQGLAQVVQFVGRLEAPAQAAQYAAAQWYLSQPQSDSVAVSVLEAMAHGCLPVLSDLPANRELVRHGDNGLLVPLGDAAASLVFEPDAWLALRARAPAVMARNRAWVAQHALFMPCVEAMLARLQAFDA